MKAIHIICRRKGKTFKDLEPVHDERGVYRSSCWALKGADPSDLLGGWIYLHPVSKNAPSEFGGIICSYEPCKRPKEATKDGLAFVF